MLLIKPRASLFLFTAFESTADAASSRSRLSIRTRARYNFSFGTRQQINDHRCGAFSIENHLVLFRIIDQIQAYSTA